MSSIPFDDTDIDPDDPEAVIREHRELIERIADSDLPISDDMQRLIDYVEQNGGGGGD